MPLVHVHMLNGRTPEAKQQLIEEITRVMVEVAGARRERVMVIIDEHSPDAWGVAGQSLAAETAATGEPR